MTYASERQLYRLSIPEFRACLIALGMAVWASSALSTTSEARRAAAALAIGEFHNCVIGDDGLYCWGRNGDGEIGIGTTSSGFDTDVKRARRVALPGGQMPVGVATSGAHSCAILEDGQVSCWGSDAFGLLGNDDAEFEDKLVPQPPLTLPVPGRAIQIVAGNLHTCVLIDSGEVTCWGGTSNGQAGSGSFPIQTTAPTSTVVLPAGRFAVSIAAGGSHACAVLDDASLVCWGRNADGQLGDNSDSIRSALPVQVPPLSDYDVLAVSAGARHSCAILDTPEGPRLSCWGSNADGQLGLGAAVSGTKGMTALLDLSDAQNTDPDVLAVSAGVEHTCALLASGDLKCWGTDLQSQLGNGDSLGDIFGPSLDEDTLIEAPPGGGWLAVDTGSQHTCGTTAKRQVFCWGGNARGQLGVGPGTRSLKFETPDTPVSIELADAKIVEVAAGAAGTCARSDAGTVSCWGETRYLGAGTLSRPSTQYVPRATATVLPEGRSATSISLHFDHACAVLDDGSIACWGVNSRGALGDGSEIDRSLPVLTDPLPGTAVSVATGNKHTCAAFDDGNVSCWGEGGGQLGRGALSDNLLSPPAPISLAWPALQVFAGDRTSCALVDAGNDTRGLTCWGSDGDGRLGNGGGRDGFISSPSPLITFPSGAEPTFSSIGTAVHCASMDNLGGNCWGQGSFGQFGQGAQGMTYWTEPFPSEFKGPDGADIARVRTGNIHSCARLTDGRIACWGRDDRGQRGDGGAADTSGTISRIPVALPGDALATAFDTGSAHTCAALTDGRVTCWGDDRFGQNGDGGIDTLILDANFNKSPTDPFVAALSPLRPASPVTLAQVNLKVDVQKQPDALPEAQGERYLLTLTNTGLDAAIGAVLDLALSSSLTPDGWSCQASGGASCALGAVATQMATLDLPVGGTVEVSLDVLVDPGDDAFESVTASIIPDALTHKELDATDNSDTSSDLTEDDDLDGVFNDQDVCDDTPSEESGNVNSQGCGPSQRDTDSDGVNDNEDAFPNDPLETADTDGDGLGDNREAELGTDPSKPDTDGDGFSDRDEVDAESNPLSPDDIPTGTGLNIILIQSAIDASRS